MPHAKVPYKNKVSSSFLKQGKPSGSAGGAGSPGGKGGKTSGAVRKGGGRKVKRPRGMGRPY